MHISPALLNSYPKLAAWIVTYLPMVLNKPKVYQAFQKYSEQNTTDAAWSLMIFTFPMIDFRVMTNANGEFEGGTHPNTVFIDKGICDKFENSATDAKDPRMHLLLESTILHEMVHWGDNKDGVDQPAEEGKEFEIAAYGKDIDRYW